MANLTFLEKRKLEKLLEMGRGYVLDFSDRTFQDFVADSVGLDIFENRGGASKANCLRRFWAASPNEVVGKLVSDLIKYVRDSSEDPEVEALADECDAIASRLVESIEDHSRRPAGVSPGRVKQKPGRSAESSASIDVFVSYARPDLVAVRGIVEFLRTMGVNTWFDKKDLIAGEDWEYEIRKHIGIASLVLICLSKRSVNRKGYFHKEMKLAFEEAMKLPKGKIYIVPIRLDECELPDDLSRLHVIDVFADDGSHNFVSSMSKALGVTAELKENAHQAFADAIATVAAGD